MTATKIGSLFAGYGGLERGVQSVVGGELAWYSEHEPPTEKRPRPEQGAAKIMAHHHPGVPNLGDITLINWADVSRVDIMTGGWPCQPFSLAGRQKGFADERALWPEVARAVRVLRPRIVFLENVAAVVTAGELQRAASDLASLGYDLRWACVRASDVGAPHGRRRIFILGVLAEDAHGTISNQWWLAAPGQADSGRPRTDTRRSDRTSVADSNSAPRRWNGSGGVAPGSSQAARTEEVRGVGRGCSARAASHPSGIGRNERWTESAGQLGRPDAALGGDGTPAHSNGGDDDGWQQDKIGRSFGRGSVAGIGVEAVLWGAYEPAIRRWERVTGQLAPLPTELSPKGKPRLSPAFVEWMMGLPTGHVTDPAIGISRNAQLKALGNGVVPQQAGAAFSLLAESYGVEVAA